MSFNPSLSLVGFVSSGLRRIYTSSTHTHAAIIAPRVLMRPRKPPKPDLPLSLSPLSPSSSDIPLRFLVHFLGDIHQPLHLSGKLRGGNQGTLYSLISPSFRLLTAPSFRERPSPFLTSLSLFLSPFGRLVAAVVKFEGRRASLHSTWDGLMIQKSIRELGNYTTPLPKFVLSLPFVRISTRRSVVRS